MGVAAITLHSAFIHLELPQPLRKVTTAMTQARERVVLITGFEPYGGRGRNPAAEIAKALEGQTIEGHRVVGRTLPVSYRGLEDRLAALIEEQNPVVAISLGLWPGEPTIRLERFGVNLADFEIADNDGATLVDEAIEANGPTGRFATLPLRAIEQALLAGGIPVRLSSTAGTFLCNATLYCLMRLIERPSRAAVGGFIHVPYMPEQVALLLAETKRERRLELHQRSDLASMELSVQVRAVSIAIATTLAETGRA
jgi:pyroglutamyl-peptidase